MAAQQGFAYENNAYKALAKFGISAGSGAAGASSDRPDLEIKLVRDKTGVNKEGCELKIAPTAAGSLVLKYYDGKWAYGVTDDDPEKELLVALGNKYKLLNEMNVSGTYGKNWRGKVPFLQNDKAGKKIVPSGKTKADAYKEDIKQFSGPNEVHIPVPAKAICDYYNSKKCAYINVGTHGFFLLNKADPLKLNQKLKNKIPDFADIASSRIRVRCQYKGSGDYQFVMTLEFSKMAKSLYNIAPVMNASNITINEMAYQTEYNKQLIGAFA
jgi:hypothetical protein